MINVSFNFKNPDISLDKAQEPGHKEVGKLTIAAYTEKEKVIGFLFRTRTLPKDQTDTDLVPVALTDKLFSEINKSEIVYLKIDKLVQKLGLSKYQTKKILEFAKKSDLNLAATQIRNQILTHIRKLGFVHNLKKTLIEKLSQPVAERTQMRANDLFQKFSQKKVSPSLIKQLAAARTKGSNTISTGGKSELKRWENAEKYIRKNFSLKNRLFRWEDLCEVNRLLQEGKKLEPDEPLPGKIRDVIEMVGGFGGLLYPYPEQVGPLLEDFSHWFNEQMDLCAKDKANPIVFAAQVYQRLVSIHPFPDANGRTCRLIMDAVLQRFNILPSSLDDVSVAAFGDQDTSFSGLKLEEQSKSPAQAVETVMQGIINSYTLLGIVKPKEER